MPENTANYRYKSLPKGSIQKPMQAANMCDRSHQSEKTENY